MQDILPIPLKASRASKVVDIIDDLSIVFKSLCAKDINPEYLDALQSKIVQVLCQMEIEFLPSFFTISVHLLIHLVKEVKLGGPVHYRWMYPIERYLAHLKTFVRNKAQPEGSIAAGYILEETVTFCSRYLEGVETVFNRQRRNDDGDDVNSSSYLFNSCSWTIGKVKVIDLSHKSRMQIHRYVLTQFQELLRPFEE